MLAGNVLTHSACHLLELRWFYLKLADTALKLAETALRPATQLRLADAAQKLAETALRLARWTN